MLSLLHVPTIVRPSDAVAVICSVLPKETFVFGEVTVSVKFVGAAAGLRPPHPDIHMRTTAVSARFIGTSTWGREWLRRSIRSPTSQLRRKLKRNGAQPRHRLRTDAGLKSCATSR